MGSIQSAYDMTHLTYGAGSKRRSRQRRTDRISHLPIEVRPWRENGGNQIYGCHSMCTRTLGIHILDIRSAPRGAMQHEGLRRETEGLEENCRKPKPCKGRIPDDPRAVVSTLFPMIMYAPWQSQHGA